jgi:hypothetical protein
MNKLGFIYVRFEKTLAGRNQLTDSLKYSIFVVLPGRISDRRHYKNQISKEEVQ